MAYNQKHEELWRNCSLFEATAIIKEVCQSAVILYTIPVDLKKSNYKELPPEKLALWQGLPLVNQFYLSIKYL